MITLTVGEIDKGRNGLLCIVYDNDEQILEQRPLGLMFRDFILELNTTENEDTFNQFAERIKDDLKMGIDFIERLQLRIGTDSIH
jgi:hypothetical protein